MGSIRNSWPHSENPTAMVNTKIKKAKTLFEHVNHVNEKQTKNYWETLSEADKKNWSNYMIHRFLSMEPAFIEIVNEVQKYNLTPDMVYKFYIDVLPKGKRWLKYVKKTAKQKFESGLVELFAKHFEASILESTEYIELLSRSEIEEILDKYGLDAKTKRKYLKGI